MKERELLELSAKAAGFGPVLCYESARNCLRIGNRKSYSLWRPLTDDADALRLAVKLSILESPDWLNYRNAHISIEMADPFDATRRAIVRAAAAIGRNMS